MNSVRFWLMDGQIRERLLYPSFVKATTPEKMKQSKANPSILQTDVEVATTTIWCPTVFVLLLVQSPDQL